MPDNKSLDVVLCWHMHQPEYRDLRDGEFQLPWTYLHAIKDYIDMAVHIESTPGAHAVVNFAPVLLDQLEHYEQMLAAFFNNGASIKDSLLSALVEPSLTKTEEERQALIGNCLRANEDRLIKRFPAYGRLAELARWLCKHPGYLAYIEEQFVVDLIVWHHLAWMGETVRRTDIRVERLIKKAGGFSLQDRRELLQVIYELVASIIPRYRGLAESGQVELTTTPYAHPISPLLLDFSTATEAWPEVELPRVDHYPGGEERARWHIEKGLQTFERHFGFKPKGCWPSEGGVSTASLRLLADYGLQWAASGEGVLANSLAAGKGEEVSIRHRSFEPRNAGLACFFRDDGLSDLIGFTYADWHADDAVANFVHHLETIAEKLEGQSDAVVSIILDGENAWEYYPENGYYFLSALYRELANHPKLNLTTFARHLAEHTERHPLQKLVAGSWVYGTFSTWIGDPDKNRGWEMLVDVKKCFDEVVAAKELDEEHLRKAELQLAICEGSDWFWWFGDYNPAESVSDFERLYRRHLSNLYQILGRQPPEYLSHVFAHGAGAPAAGGVMRRGQENG